MRIFGQEIAAEITVFSSLVFELLSENVSLLFTSFDVLWVALAVGTAWRILKGKGAQQHLNSPVSTKSGDKGAAAT